MENKEFLQSKQWLKFQESVGRKTYHVESDDFYAGIVEHVLPMVGKYFYCPRGPVSLCHSERSVAESKNPELNIADDNTKRSFDKLKMTGIEELINLAKKENAGWIRIEPENDEVLQMIRENISEKIIKAPHDTQPKEIFVLDISKSEEQLLAEMKSKTRYNINVAKKHNVKVHCCGKNDMQCLALQTDFFKLTKEMAERQGISTHPGEYYRKMIEILPADMLKIYSAEYNGKVIATNLVVFYQSTAIYLHGASSNENRNVMAPLLLQWQAIMDAKERGCVKYDFGGVHIQDTRYKIQDTNKWEGITNFKLGFSPNTKPIVFPGTYDIIINSRKYAVYRGLQRAKAFAKRIRK